MCSDVLTTGGLMHCIEQITNKSKQVMGYIKRQLNGRFGTTAFICVICMDTSGNMSWIGEEIICNVCNMEYGNNVPP